MTARLLLGDCRAHLSEMEPQSIDAIVCDPPYELGFMGKAWDASGVAFSVDVWRACLRVLKPGGHLLAFGGTRTYHRMACAIEDAGFEVRDCLMWVYGSGFPKSLDVSKAIDKAAGAQREVIGRSQWYGRNPNGRKKAGDIRNYGVDYRTDDQTGVITAPATDSARTWEGWGTALKPAWEPIVMARKPLEGTVAANVLKHGTGGLNIDGCRVGYADAADYAKLAAGVQAIKARGGSMANSWANASDLSGANDASALGRWPANVIHDGSETISALFLNAPGQLATTRADGAEMGNQIYGAMRHPTEAREPRADATKSAARFFNVCPIEAEDYPPLYYVPKASRREREEGCEGLPARSGAAAVDRDEESDGLRSPRAGAGRTAGAVRNHHPTVKPIAVMRHLCRLVTPAGGLVLDPFMGSGTTGIAALREGFSFVGIEMDPDHFRICEARIGAALPSIFGGSHASK